MCVRLKLRVAEVKQDRGDYTAVLISKYFRKPEFDDVAYRHSYIVMTGEKNL